MRNCYLEMSLLFCAGIGVVACQRNSDERLHQASGVHGTVSDGRQLQQGNSSFLSLLFQEPHDRCSSKSSSFCSSIV